MAVRQLVAGEPIGTGVGARVTWDEARQRLEEAQFYWLATSGPDGRPHVMPVLAVWLDGTPYFCTGAASRKAQNLRQNGRCSLAVDSDELHLVLEGVGRKVTEGSVLHRAAEAYRSKYGWEATALHGALHGDGAPTAGPPPYDVYAVTPTTVFGLGTDDTYSAMRWRFEPDS